MTAHASEPSDLETYEAKKRRGGIKLLGTTVAKFSLQPGGNWEHLLWLHFYFLEI